MSSLIPFVLAADDYGISPGVGAGIRALLKRKRLSAASCLVVSPHFRGEAPLLRDLAPEADIGLHLALTQFPPLGPMPRLAPSGRLPETGRLVLLALAGRLDAAEIGGEIDRQLDAFERALGRPPDYVDGHHHVQQLPVIADALLRRFATRLPRGTALRRCAEPLGAVLKRGIAAPRAAAVALLGKSLARRAAALGVPGNRRFAGVRDFTETLPYRQLFLRFVAGAPRALAVMCHPGHPDAALGELDHVTLPRQGEYDYLAGGEFPGDIAAAGLSLGRFKDLA
jgi:predicted glycoside hydrolase/deacetylase ChbG (UPF0249 family)